MRAAASLRAAVTSSGSSLSPFLGLVVDLGLAVFSPPSSSSSSSSSEVDGFALVHSSSFFFLSSSCSSFDFSHSPSVYLLIVVFPSSS